MALGLGRTVAVGGAVATGGVLATAVGGVLSPALTAALGIPVATAVGSLVGVLASGAVVVGWFVRTPLAPAYKPRGSGHQGELAPRGLAAVESHERIHVGVVALHP